ncbi:MAG: glucose-1-phosphate thymidylyltransferase, partial [Thermoprotei archaeon]
GGTVIKGPVYIGSNVLIGRRCVIGPYTTICDGVTIGSMTYISRSIIMENTDISNHCSVFESILGSHCSLEPGVKLPAFNIYGGTIKVLIKDKMIDSGRMYLGAIVGDEVKVRANTVIPPGTIIQPCTIVR